MKDCEFCSEIDGHPQNRFARVYGHTGLGSRIVAERGELIAMPTLGQIFEGSLLVLPRGHVETLADLSPRIIRDLCPFVSELSHGLENLGKPIFWEHAARRCTGGSCGIYHAHAHLIPLPAKARLEDLLPEGASVTAGLGDALHMLRGASTYLLMIDSDGRVGFSSEADIAGGQYRSQYLRRALVERFDLCQPWDWRTYDSVEPMLLNTVRHFAGVNGTLCQPTR